MSDFFHINDGSFNKRIFYANGPMYVSAATTSTAFQTWQKPIGAKFVHFFVLGAGAGGGISSNGSTGGKGGGGGGSAGHVTGLFLANLLPDILYINVGVGGIGGLPSSTGSALDGSGGDGALSYVMIYPDTSFTATNVLLQSGSAAAIGGRTGGSVSTNGQAGTVWTPTGNIFNKLGLISAYAGQAGGAGVTGAQGLNVLISGITTGGAGGSGTNTGLPINGGSIIGYGKIPTISGGTTASTLTINGSGNYMSSRPNTVGMTYGQMFFSGGAGGASIVSGGDGGRGGDGAFGCGGGGGGGFVTGVGFVNNGKGGRGGDGLVIITCW